MKIIKSVIVLMILSTSILYAENEEKVNNNNKYNINVGLFKEFELDHHREISLGLQLGLGMYTSNESNSSVNINYKAVLYQHSDEKVRSSNYYISYRWQPDNLFIEPSIGYLIISDDYYNLENMIVGGLACGGEIKFNEKSAISLKIGIFTNNKYDLNMPYAGFNYVYSF